MNRLTLLSASALLFLVACEAPVPGGLSQYSGNDPLIVDMDETDPLVAGVQSEATVRGPNKGGGERGGLTGSFLGVGGPMCVILDPENEWEQDDTPTDDGDMDLFVGRAADYTGTPGVTIGDFFGEYIDSLGVPHQLDQNLCYQVDINGVGGAHAGQGTAEFCTIQTDAGTPYIVLGETFSVPSDDDQLVVAVRVDVGGCPAIDETTLSGDN